MSVWVIVEQRHGSLREVTGELLAAAADLGAGPVTAIVLTGPGESALLAQGLTGADGGVLAVEHAGLTGFNGRAVAAALGTLAQERNPKVILGAHSAAGVDWAPALAARLRAPLVTDVLGLAWRDGALTAVRAVYGGKLQAQVRLPAAPTAVATLRPGTWKAQAAAGSGPVETVTAAVPDDLGKRFLEWGQEAAGDVDITQADVLVSVGRGIADAENLDLAKALAEALGATLSCSRPVVDSGWLPKERQVGISGKTVKPKLYLAIGISGAFQHVTAMQGATLIVAINKDPKAPIFRVAQYGIVGDLFKVVPALTKAVQEAKGRA